MAIQVKLALMFASVLLTGCPAEGATLFSQLSHTLTVSVAGNGQNSSTNGTQAGSGDLRVTWGLNTLALNDTNDSGYKTVDLKLCFGAPSQVDRAWRKTNDLLSKDKTCLYDITSQPYSSAGNITVWTVTKQVPFAYYFVRAYVLDASGEKIAYGQTTNAQRTSNLFIVEPISGRHSSIDIAAGVFSAFSVVSLFGFFFFEKYAAKKNTKS